MTEKSCTVSIVMPAYNCVRFLPDAFRSLEQQRPEADEIIVVDDGSTDGTAAWLDEYAAAHRNVTCIHTANAGPSHARNVGMAAAQGEWVQFMDSDDCLEPGMLAAMQEQTGSETDLVICGAVRQDIADGKRQTLVFRQNGAWKAEKLPELLLGMDITDKRVLLHYIWNKWYRRETITENGLRFDESLCLGEDFAFNCAYLQKVREVRIIPECFYNWRIRDSGSLSTRFVAHEAVRRRKMYDAFCALAEHFGVLRQMLPAICAMEGFQRWSAMQKVGAPSCRLPWKQKTAYLQSLLAAPGKEQLLSYLKTLNGGSAALKAALVKAGRTELLYLLFRAKNCFKS